MPIVIVSSVTPMSVAIEAGSTDGAADPAGASVPAGAAVPLGSVVSVLAVTPEAPTKARPRLAATVADNHLFFMYPPVLVGGWLVGGG